MSEISYQLLAVAFKYPEHPRARWPDL